MELSAWDIYWVLQLDSISETLFALSVVVGFGLLAAAPFLIDALSDDEWRVPVRRALRWGLAVFAISVAGNAFLPSSKTAAAMIIVPAIVNNDTIQKEAADLYGLAKEALREAVQDEEPKK